MTEQVTAGVAGGLTREDSRKLYGIAIILMLFHHLFCIPGRLNCSYTSAIDALFGPGTQMHIAWVCKICVAIYAFISGYAYFVNASKRDPVMTAVRQAIAFLKKFWIVCVVFLPVSVARGNLDLLEVISHMLLRISYANMEWWYVKFYMGILIMLPFVHCITTQTQRYLEDHPFGPLLALMAGSIAAGLLSIFLGLQPSYTLICLEGYFAAKFKIFEKTEARLSAVDWAKTLEKLGLLLICLVLRWLLSRSPDSDKVDVLIIVPFIFSVAGLLRECRHLSRGLSFLGKHSTYIWLTHTFFIYYYFQPFFTFSRNSLIMFVQLGAASVLTSIVLTAMEKLLDKILCAANRICITSRR